MVLCARRDERRMRACRSPVHRESRLGIVNRLAPGSRSVNRFPTRFRRGTASMLKQAWYSSTTNALVLCSPSGASKTRVRPPLNINMEAVTSTDYDSANLSRNFNQIGFSTYNYSQFEEKYKTQQMGMHSDDYRERSRNQMKIGPNGQVVSHYPNDSVEYINQKNPRSHSQPEKQHHSFYETRSKSQDTRELTFYQIDAPQQPLKHESRHTKCHRSIEKSSNDIIGLNIQDKKDSKLVALDKNEKREKASIKHNHVKSEQKINGATNNNQPNKLETVDIHSTNHKQVEPPKYRPFDRPPKYQEDPPRCELPPKYYQEPPKYCEATRRQDDPKRLSQEEKGRRQVGARGGSVNGLGGEAPVNLASLTPTAREATRSGVTPRHRQTHKQNDVRATLDNLTETKDEIVDLKNHIYQQPSSRNNFNGGIILGVNVVGGGVICPEVMLGCNDGKYIGTMDNYIKSSDNKSGLKLDKTKCESDNIKVGGKFLDKIRSVQEAMHKQHDTTKSKNNHEPMQQPVISHVGYKVDNLKYYGELKGFKSYGAIDKPPVANVHEKSHQHAGSSEKNLHSTNNHEKIHARSLQGYCSNKIGDKSVYSDKYSDHYYRSGYHQKSSGFPVFQETKYAYSVNGVPGTPAQASAAAAFFAR
ncbi:hypothetical protein PV325_002350 [Microctonus aethiopoides]|nr:hypothetical protein PV325_002350 [Microctonus aethiopoides]